MSETNPLRALRYLHTIHAAPECERLRHIYQHVFGGLVFHESYYPPEDRDAALLYVADHMIEVMSPRDPDNMDFMYARYVRKSGPSWHSISFRVADCALARAHCEASGIVLNTTGPGLIFLHPRSTGGIIMELTDHRMPNDPWDLPNWRRDWAAGRPNRPHALDHIVCAPRDPAAAIAFLTGPLGGTAGASHAVDWPQRATATPVDVADARLLVLEPEDRGSGPLIDFTKGLNAGVYALAWRIADPAAGAAWFAENGIPVAALPGGGGCSHEALLDGARHWIAAG
jgi:4-hydroxyphenylpyruvate dioxygenase-like putative hemolysin